MPRNCVNSSSGHGVEDEVCLGSPSELRSLLEFKKGITEYPLGRVRDSWKPSSLDDTTVCPHSWEGILCDDLTGNVTGIVLDNLRLAGELKFHTLLDLKMLKNLSLSGNHFTGRLPPSFGALTSLQHLDLSDNNFYGPIPARISELWGLNSLNLSLNKFKGGFPTGLPNLQQLRVLDLHSNQLWAEDINESHKLHNAYWMHEHHRPRAPRPCPISNVKK